VSIPFTLILTDFHQNRILPIFYRESRYGNGNAEKDDDDFKDFNLRNSTLYRNERAFRENKVFNELGVAVDFGIGSDWLDPCIVSMSAR
jgi:hypothetical protein